MARSTNNITLNLFGDEEVQRALKNMAQDVTGKVLRAATQNSMKPYARDAKKRMAEISPTIAKAIGNRTKLYAKKGVVVNVVGIKRETTPTIRERTVTMPDGSSKTFKRKHDPRNTAHLVEFGTKPHKITIPWLSGRFLKYKADHPGTQEYAPMRKALEAQKDTVLRTMRREVLGGVEKLAIKEAKKAARAAKKASAA